MIETPALGCHLLSEKEPQLSLRQSDQWILRKYKDQREDKAPRQARMQQPVSSELVVQEANCLDQKIICT